MSRGQWRHISDALGQVLSSWGFLVLIDNVEHTSKEFRIHINHIQ